jgi:hypothetical protein
LKALPSERFGKVVGGLIACRHMDILKIALVNLLAEEMVAAINMLSSLTVFGVQT